MPSIIVALQYANLPLYLFHAAVAHRSVQTGMPTGGNAWFVLPIDPNTIYIARNAAGVAACSTLGDHNCATVVENVGHANFPCITGEADTLYTR